ncbi:metallothionein [Pseudomonas sp. RIT-PI-S]|uniref:metallothionein n=1 Tax=Pseudomonas sp. RIT-PI-S TaxID=3035295 RepID=UPI0021D8BD46|nr:metallothionein [Pseudomonas sp. RIT-PI-S]
MPQTCACPQCKALAKPSFNRDGQAFCSYACAERHPDKQPCPRSDCHCEHAVLEEDERKAGALPPPQCSHDASL